MPLHELEDDSQALAAMNLKAIYGERYRRSQWSQTDDVFTMGLEQKFEGGICRGMCFDWIRRLLHGDRTGMVTQVSTFWGVNDEKRRLKQQMRYQQLWSAAIEETNALRTWQEPVTYADRIGKAFELFQGKVHTLNKKKRFDALLLHFANQREVSGEDTARGGALWDAFLSERVEALEVGDTAIFSFGWSRTRRMRIGQQGSHAVAFWREKEDQLHFFDPNLGWYAFKTPQEDFQTFTRFLEDYWKVYLFHEVLQLSWEEYSKKQARKP